MKPERHLIILVIVLLTTVGILAQSPQEQLRNFVTLLQTTPGDDALREKIIKLAATMKPAPVIPEEAKRNYVKGGTFVEATKDAKDAADGYGLAIAAFREAVRIAPWWGDAYFNLGLTLGLAGKFDEAITSLKLSMASVPADSKEARDTQNRIYTLEAKAELAAKKVKADTEAERIAAEKAAADSPAAREAALLQKVEGATFVYFQQVVDDARLYFEIRGARLHISDYYASRPHLRLLGNVPYRNGQFFWTVGDDSTNFQTITIRPDGQALFVKQCAACPVIVVQRR